MPLDSCIEDCSQIRVFDSKCFPQGCYYAKPTVQRAMVLLEIKPSILDSQVVLLYEKIDETFGGMRISFLAHDFLQILVADCSNSKLKSAKLRPLIVFYNYIKAMTPAK